ncbi:hypothetical protein [Haloplanus salinarum]|uniref:hypothetical protein n=1 Tax=Haloplanus salinarum TaxID=1912324 RepID=UPI00214D0D60|nr:hypothetical protein [Haloplanus salinarum]
MTTSNQAIEEELDRLEEDAEEIETLYTDFFNNIQTRASEIGGGGYYWNTPSEELEQIQREALQKYEVWYNTALPLVTDYIPSRRDDFEHHYQEFKNRLRLDKKARRDTRKVLNAQNSDFDSQRSLLRSIPSKIRVEELRVRKQISRDVSQTEHDKARDLYEEGEIRASGVIAGVALERYLLMRCENAGVDIDYNYDDGIDALAQKLYEGNEINKSPYQHLKHLSSIRADCAHANEEDPAEKDVKRLLEDTEDYIRGRRI